MWKEKIEEKPLDKVIGELISFGIREETKKTKRKKTKEKEKEKEKKKKNKSKKKW